MQSVDQLRNIQNLSDRFVAIQETIEDRETSVIPSLISERGENPHNFELEEEIALVHYEIALLAIERARTVKELIEREGHSFGSIAALTGTKLKTDREGNVVEDENGAAILVPALSRQRIHQIYNGSSAYTDPGKRKKTKAKHPRTKGSTTT